MATTELTTSTAGGSNEDLVAIATQALAPIPLDNEKHSVASAARSRSGQTFVGLNVYHFTGGPCAEMTVLGVAAAAGVLAEDLTTIVAVVRRPGKTPGEEPTIKILSPCGRCRQVLVDYNPDIRALVVDAEGGLVARGMWDLLPNAYIWPDGNTGQAQAKALDGMHEK